MKMKNLIIPFLTLLTTCTALSTNLKAMEDGSFDSHSTSRAGPTGLPLEIWTHIFSFLDHRNLVKAGGISKDLREAAKIVWEKKPLDLSKIHLSEAGSKALEGGPFSSLMLKSKYWKTEKDLITALASKLVKLDLSGSGIGDDGLKELILTAFPVLKKINLSKNHIGTKGAKCIKPNKLPVLTWLNLSENNLRVGGAKALAENRIFVELKTLNLSANFLGPKGASWVALCNFPVLRKLDLSNNNIEAEGAEEFATKSKHAALTALDLTNNNIRRQGVKGIAKLFGLIRLNLSINVVGHLGTEYLANGDLTRLEMLNLDRNSIEDEGAMKLAAPDSKLSALTTLSLIGNNIGAAGKESLTTSKSLTALKVLDLYSTNMNRGAAPLKNRHLIKHSLGNDDLTLPPFKKFKE